MFLLSIVIYLTVLRYVWAACTNTEDDSFCDAGLATGDCYFVSNRNCRCSKSCNSPPACSSSSLDTDCMCFTYAYMCPSIISLCPTSCDRRENLTCQPLPVVSHATPSPNPPAYSDKVTFSCDNGYQMAGGKTGLRVCIENGAWLVHNVNGTPPVCEPVSCGAPPTVQNFVASSSVGYYGESVTYSCPEKTVRVGGGSATHLCNISGFWVADSSDNIPDCKETDFIFRNSKSEMTGSAPPSTSRGRSNIDCARQCAVMDSCHGYTFVKESFTCSFNSETAAPVITEMKKT